MDNKEILFNELKNILEVKDIDENFLLEGNMFWDSLAIVSSVALFDQIFQKRVTGDELVVCKTVFDLLTLAQ